MEWRDEGIVLYTRPMGERSHLVSLLTKDRGKENGAVRISKKDVSILEVGTCVSATWKARLETQLGFMTLEMTHPTSALLLDDAIGLRLLQCASVLAYMTLPQGYPYPNLYNAFLGFLGSIATPCVIPAQAGIHSLTKTQSKAPHFNDNFDSQPDTRPPEKKWIPASAGMTDGGSRALHTDKPARNSLTLKAFIQFEMTLLQELGFGLDLKRCAVTGIQEGLVAVSPKTGRAVSHEPAQPYLDKLLPLPAFLTSANDDFPPISEILKALDLTGYFLERYLLSSLSLEMPKVRGELKRFVHRFANREKETHYAS